MSRNAAKEEVLGKIHKALAERYLALLEAGESDPRILSAIGKFLNDNGTKAQAFVDESLSALEESLKNRSRQFADISKAAKESASESVH